MGIGSKLLHFGEAAAGVGLLIGTGGAAAPYAIPLIAGGVGGVAQDFSGDSAEKKQIAATNEAKQYGAQALAQQQGLLGPYAQAGQGAMTNLASLMGGGMTAAPMGEGGMPSGSGTNLASMGNAPNTASPPTSDMEGRANVPVMQNPEDQNQSGYATAVTQGMRSAQARNGGGTVTLRAPNGEIEEVPAELVDHFIQHGATEVQA